MKREELVRYDGEWYDANIVDCLLDEKDMEIASLKAQIAEAKELSIELQKRNKAIADNAISNVESYKSKRDAEIESLKASHYAEMVDAGMRERRQIRALWLARALRARDIQRWWIAATCSPTTERACGVWNNVERKCLKKAGFYL